MKKLIAITIAIILAMNNAPCIAHDLLSTIDHRPSTISALRPMATTHSKLNNYYLMSAWWPNLRYLYDDLPQVFADKVVACAAPPYVNAPIDNVTSEEEQQILTYFRKHVSEAKKAGAVPILLGGGHMSSYWFYIALKEVYGNDIDIISFDMDTDTMSYELNECGFWTHGMKKGIIPPERLTVVGIGGPSGHEAGIWAVSQGTVFSKDTIPEDRKYENVFISLDVDVFWRLDSKKLGDDIAGKLSDSNILGLHIATLESEYIEGLRDSELDIITALFPQAFEKTEPVETQWLQPFDNILSGRRVFGYTKIETVIAGAA